MGHKGTVLAQGFVPFALPREASLHPTIAPSPSLDPVRLPRDELSHDYPVEWWYFVGHLSDTASADRLSFMLTAIRGTISILPPATLSFFKRIDHQAGPLPLLQCGEPFLAAYEGSEHPVSYRFRYRGNVFNLWIASPESWEIDGQPGAYHVRLWNAAGGIEMDVDLDCTAPAVLVDGNGIVDYGSGHQLAYYLRPKVAVRGRARIGGTVREVRGSGWYERQWGAVPTDSFAWKYLNVSLDDGEQWIFFHTRLGASVRYYAGRMPAAGGLEALPIDPGDFRDIEVGGRPLGTDLAVRTSAGRVELHVRPLFGTEDDIRSMYPGMPPFWESVCRVEGTRGGIPVQGWSMTELHAYG